MSRTLHIIVNCAERKRTAENSLRLRDFRHLGADRATTWWRTLAASPLPRTAAIDLYLGDHWTSVLSLVRRAEQLGWDAQLWISSAGYGLIPGRALIVPYAATFTNGHADSVALEGGMNTRAEVRAWWNALSRFHGTLPGTPRSVRKLALTSPDSAFLLALSATYLAAMVDDIVEAREHLTDPDRLVIVSGTGANSARELAPNWVPSQEVFRGELGGTCTSLNPKVARRVLEECQGKPWNAAYLRRFANLWAAGLPPLDKPSRTPMTDTEVIAFIQAEIALNPDISHTGLLRKLRNTSQACEQKRFRDIFRSLQGTLT